MHHFKENTTLFFFFFKLDDDSFCTSLAFVQLNALGCLSPPLVGGSCVTLAAVSARLFIYFFCIYLCLPGIVFPYAGVHRPPAEDSSGPSLFASDTRHVAGAVRRKCTVGSGRVEISVFLEG